MADSLANLASAWKGIERSKIRPLTLVRATKPCYEEEIVSRINEDKEQWFYDIENYIRDGKYPENAKPSERTTLRKLASQFILFDGILYKRAFDGMQLRCVNQ